MASSELPITKVAITFNGKPMACRSGTSLAVSLWEHGVRHISHGHKFGRPRGLLCARGHCTNCLVRVDGIPNIRSCEASIRQGMVVSTQDTGAFYAAPMQKILSLGSQWMPVGFYFKWFTKPASLSRFFLASIRPLAGVGRLPDAISIPTVRQLPDAPEKSKSAPAPHLGRYDHVVIGAGPSGLATAAELSGNVLLLDEGTELGGQRVAALRSAFSAEDQSSAQFPVLSQALARIKRHIEKAQSNSRITAKTNCRVTAGYHPDGLVMRDSDGLKTVRFDHLIWAGGALDTLGLFPGNDTPGIFGPRALYRLLTRDGLDVKGQHVLLTGSGLDLWLCATLLTSRGATVTLVVTAIGGQHEVAAAIDLKWPVHTGLKLSEVREVSAGRIQASFLPGSNAPGPAGSHLRFESDFVVICAQGKPTYDVPYQVGADLAMVPGRGGYVPRDCEKNDNNAVEQTLPNGVRLTFTGEALGHSPAEQVRR
ncbi:MAG: thioredoxin reductase [Candidatus Krumholzibacteriia bacterium]